MAKKKSSSKKKSKVPVEIFGILYIVLTILGLLRSGFVGKMVSNFSIFLFGAYYNWGLVFFLILGSYVLLFRQKPKLLNKKLVGFYLFSIAILSMSHVKYIMCDTNIGKVVFQDTLANIVSGFNDVNFIQGGGILGAIFSYLFVIAFDIVGSKIICWALILFGAMLIFNISPASFIKKIILLFIPKKKDKGEDLSKDDNNEEKEDEEDKKVVISNINDLSHVSVLEKEEEKEEETNEAEKTCTDNGGTWDGSACTYPSTEPTTPDPGTTTEPTTPGTGTDTSTDTTTGYVWFDRRNLYNIFDRL